jgi:hypothetical protein
MRTSGPFQAGYRTPEGNARAVDSFKRASRSTRTMRSPGPGWPSSTRTAPINADARPPTWVPRARPRRWRAIRANPTLSEAQAASGLELWLIDWTGPARRSRASKAVASIRARLCPRDTGPCALAVRPARRGDGRHPSVLAIWTSRPTCIRHVVTSGLPESRLAGRTGPRAPGCGPQPRFLDRPHAAGAGHRGERNNVLALRSLENAISSPAQQQGAISLAGYILGRMGRGRRGTRRPGTHWKPRRRSAYMPPYAMALVHLGPR